MVGEGRRSNGKWGEGGEGGLEEEANWVGGSGEGMGLQGNRRRGEGVGEGRACSLASINSFDNSCYLLRTSPPSNKRLLGASRVPGTVPRPAESISTGPALPDLPSGGSTCPGPVWSHFNEEETEDRGRVKAPGREDGWEWWWPLGGKRKPLGQCSNDVELRHEWG